MNNIEFDSTGEINKQLRLPKGVKSWYQLATKLDSLDRLNIQKDTAYFGNNMYDIIVNTDTDGVVEVVGESFYCDYITLKARAFDELNTIIPEQKELEHYLYILSIYENSDLDELKDFINKLRKLQYGEYE